jgi:nicotinate phosphoribosyltransferase
MMRKEYDILSTDFYQISMATAYLLLDQADRRAGFEAFVRHVKPAVTAEETYVFHGSNSVHEFINSVKAELRSGEFIDTFIALIKPKLPADRREEYVVKLREKLNTAKKDFQFSVVAEKSIVFPYVPVFQFNGPIWIGQLIETPILNIINGQTGMATRFNSARTFAEYAAINVIQHITGRDRDDFRTQAGAPPEARAYYDFYRSLLVRRAVEYREATSKVILEAAFRRAPGLIAAIDASRIAITNGWNGTSNVAAYLASDLDDTHINGTMAHSFIMSQKDELTAYQLWNSIFPNSTFLIDTYDVQEAIKMLVANNLKPACVRIDSAPLDEYARIVRNALVAAGWGDVQIFLSGDITPELLKDFEKRQIPFDKVMAGTEYVNIYDAKSLNAGYVYKLVEIEDKDDTGCIYVRYPLKKATGKSNYAGLKTIAVENNNVVVTQGFGLAQAIKIKRDMTPIFSGLSIHKREDTSLF